MTDALRARNVADEACILCKAPAGTLCSYLTAPGVPLPEGHFQLVAPSPRSDAERDAAEPHADRLHLDRHSELHREADLPGVHIQQRRAEYSGRRRSQCAGAW